MSVPVIRLLAAQIRRHPFRIAATILAVGIAVVVVGFGVRGSQVARQQVIEASRQFGRFDVIITPRDFGVTQLDPALVAAVRADPAIADLDVAVKTRVRVLSPDPVPQPDGGMGGMPAGGRGGPGGGTGPGGGPGAGGPGGGRRPAAGGMGGPFGGSQAMGTGAAVPPQALADGRWIEAAGTAREAVVTTAFQARYGLRLGSPVTIAGNGAELTVTVVGTIAVKGPVPGVRMMPSPHLADLYLPQAVAAELNGFADRPGLLALTLRDPEQAGAFAKTWRGKTAASEPAVRIRSTQDEPEDPMGGPPSGMQQMLFATTSLGAILAAGFITFLSLSIGVRSRMRQYAILRALALSRWQLAQLVAGEALVIALGGVAAGLVLLYAASAGCRLLAGVAPVFAGPVFDPGQINGMVVMVGLLSGLLGAASAVVVPLWQVVRIRPVDILGGQGIGGSGRFPWPWVIAGLAMMLLNPVLVLLGHYEPVRQVIDAGQKGVAAVVGRSMGFGVPIAGSLLMIVGMGLAAPLGLRLVELLLHCPAAGVLRLDSRLLRQQLTGSLWRSVGTIVALSTGLTLYVAAVVWGFSMLVPFTPTDALPRLQVAILPAGLPDEAVPEFLAIEGIRPERCLPMAVEQPRLNAETLARPGFAHVDEQQRHVLVMGVDPQRAFGGPDPMFRLDFVAGDAASAAAGLASGRGCVIPDHFATQCGLKLGDTFAVEVPEGGGPDVAYTVVGIASIPGWNWMTKFSEIRRRAGRALAIVFAGHDQTRRDFAIERTSFFWLDPAGDAKDPDLVRNLAARIEPVGRRHARVNLNVPRAGRTAVGTQYVNITDREDIKERIAKRAGDVIGMMRWMPLVTLVIASLAVFNAILASVRARSWQFGILRGIGMTRGQLARLVLGESLLLGLAAAVLSLAAGVGLAWCGTRLSALFFFFAGRLPPLVLPWGDLALGMAIAIGVSVLAGLLPALAAGRTEPLRFIQAGRLST